MILRLYRIFWVCILLSCFSSTFVIGESSFVQEYSINAVETGVKTHEASTAVIDSTAKEIRLPRKAMPNSIAFLGEGFDYYMVTGTDAIQYSFDGSEMVENRTLLPATVQNPCGVSTQRDGLDYFLTEDRGSEFNINYYGFDGSESILNPAMTLTGQQNVLSVAYIDPERMGILSEDKMRFYAFNGSALINQQEIDVEDPIAVATDGYMNVVIATESKVDYYGFSGTDYINIPAMSFQFGANEQVRGIGVNANGVFALKSTSLTGYEYDGVVIKESMAISKSGFIDAVAMAVHPESNDILILDRIDSAQNKYRMRYLMYDGSELIENAALSVDISNLILGGRYVANAELIFKEGILATPVADYLRIRAYTVIPENTQITFYVANTASAYPSETEWKESWKVNRAVGGPATIYKSVPSGSGTVWEMFGTLEKGFPNFDSSVTEGSGSEAIDPGDIAYANGEFTFPKSTEAYLTDLWTEMPTSKDRAYFKAVLETTDSAVTPKIVVPQEPNITPAIADNRAVVMEAGTQPGTVTVKPPGTGLSEIEIEKFTSEFGAPPQEGWVYTTTPEIEWEYSGAQTAYQVVVLGRKGGNGFVVAYDSGKVSGADGLSKKAIIPTSTDPSAKGALVASDTYDFAVTVRVWQGGFVSDFGEPVDFKVLAFDRPRIISISSPPDGQTSPVPETPSTHALIRRDTPASSLPKAKTGALLVVRIDSIGPIRRGPDDPKRVGRFYGDTPNGNIETAYGDSSVLKILGNGTSTNEWTFEFWSSAPIEVIPDQTVLKAQFLADAYQGGGAIMLLPPYAAGVAYTGGTVYQDWTVILEGSEE